MSIKYNYLVVRRILNSLCHYWRTSFDFLVLKELLRVTITPKPALPNLWLQSLREELPLGFLSALRGQYLKLWGH